MPRYSTTTTIYTMLPGLVNNTANTNIISLTADRIGGEVDSYIAWWYQVSGWTTSAATPQSVQGCSDALVMERTLRSLFTRDAQNKNEWVEEQAKGWRKWLQDVKAGKAKIFDSTGSEVSRADRGKLVHTTHGAFQPIFDVDADTTWGIDSDLQDQINSDRS